MMNSRERRLCLWSNATCAMPSCEALPSRRGPRAHHARQAKAKSLSVKILKNEPNTARLSWVLANEEFLTVEIPRHALERFMVQAKRAIEEAPLISRERSSE